jgi:hypothetical protein
MTTLLGAAITALVVVILGTFARALASLRRLPLHGRPKTPTYDRYGNLIGQMENPDFHENPGEDASQEAGLAPAANPPRAE